MIAFGPVPSRRLGASLGVNNIPPKVCSYSCVYCQIGPTPLVEIERREFYPPERVAAEVRDLLAKLRATGQPVDCLSFVPDGEPTLDINLGREIALLKPLGIKIAVLTNGSLIGRADVRADLMEADLVSLKIAAVSRAVWQRIHQPHCDLDLDRIHEGMQVFAASYRGRLVTETVLIRDVNDDEQELGRVAAFVKELKPAIAYLGVVTRPPAETWVQPPDSGRINAAYQIFAAAGVTTELMGLAGGGSFGFSGDVEKDILNTAAVHPMSEEQVRDLLTRAGADWSLVERLKEEGRVVELDYHGSRFYLKSLTK